MEKFDIFLSCDHRDYNKAKKIYEYLKESSCSVFFADKSLRILGDTDYRKVIDNALDLCNHLIVYTSKPEHTESAWVEYEWGSFCNEKRSGRKSGNLIVIIDNEINIGSLPYALRNTQVISHQDYPEHLIHFLKNTDVIPFFTPKRKTNFLDKRVPIKYLFMIVVCFTVLSISTILYLFQEKRTKDNTRIFHNMVTKYVQFPIYKQNKEQQSENKEVNITAPVYVGE
jgi:hypothetical protein